MCITDRNRNPNTVDRGANGANTLEAVVRRWRLTSWRIRGSLSRISDPRLRAEIQRLIDAYWTGNAPDPTPRPEEPRPEERAQALAMVCEALLRQFDDEQAGAAEIRLVVHKRGEVPTESGLGPRPGARPAVDAEDAELVWELRRLLASSGGTIADVVHALERRGDDVDRNGRDLLHDEVRAVEVDIAVLKTLLFEPVDWDGECKRLLADEVPPFEDRVDYDDYDGEDD